MQKINLTVGYATADAFKLAKKIAKGGIPPSKLPIEPRAPPFRPVVARRKHHLKSMEERRQIIKYIMLMTYKPYKYNHEPEHFEITAVGDQSEGSWEEDGENSAPDGSFPEPEYFYANTSYFLSEEGVDMLLEADWEA